MKSILQTLSQLWGLIVGLGITGKYFLSKDVTVYYPRQTVSPEAIESFRGPIELVGLDDNPSVPRCISCMMCVQACPSGCITVAKSAPPKPTEQELLAMKEAEARGEKPKKPVTPKHPSKWEYNYTLCSLCGMCVETCPVESIRFSHNAYLAGTTADDFHYDLLHRLRRLHPDKTNEAIEHNTSGGSQGAVTPQTTPLDSAGQEGGTR